MAKKYSFWVLFILLLVAHACIVLSIHYFPFADVPNHLAEATVYKLYNSASNDFSKYYELNYFMYPNTFHLLFFSLPVFSGVEIANKIFHLLIITSLPLLVLLIIAELKGNKWFAVASFILVYGFNLTFGFTDNALANNVVLLILWLWLRSVDERRNHVANMLGIAALLVAVYFLHAMMALFSLLMVFSFIMYRYRANFKGLVAHSFVLVPLGLLIVYWWFFLQHSAESTTGYRNEDVSTLQSMEGYYAGEFLQTYKWRLMFLFADNYQLFAGNTGYLVGVLLSFILIVPLLYIFYRVIFKKKQIFETVPALQDNKFAYIIILLIVAASCFFLLPKRIPGQEPLYERFCTILLLAILFIGSKIFQENNRVFAIAASLVAIAHLALWGQYFQQFDQENQNFVELLPQDKTKVLSYLNYDPEFRGRMVYDQFQNYFIVRKHGIATSKIIDFRFGMIRRKESGGLPTQGDIYRGAGPRELMKRADYLLVRGTPYAAHQRILDSLGVFSQVKQEGKWHLLERHVARTAVASHAQP
ncbi:hypothetical protein [Hymenobacter norwichensis]|uniref:hypothetical protein n=1 Tax=Hymenobacter norwichensis TaxID=223903 RepID=UPI0003B5D806|nr:hypothetical protein [Hymenobacter norwichensis]